MAAANSLKGLQEEATCPICLEYFTDPVTTKCGHNFCRSCISTCTEGTGATLPCPQCRELCPQGELSINRRLQSMVQLMKQLSVQQERPPAEGLCEEHEERLKIFCEEDEKLICVVCRESSDHEQHKVRPVKEAAERYKRELQDCLQPLREQKGAVQQCKLKEEEGCTLLRNKLEAERRKIETEFKQLQQNLKEQKQTQLRRLEEMEEKITTVENVQMAKLSAEMASLQTLITEKEKKCEQPAGEFLKCELQDCLKPLRVQLGAVQQFKLKEEEGCRLLRNKLEAERRKIESEFKELQKTLKEQEQTLLRRLQEMEKKITTVENVQMAKLSAEMASLQTLMTEMVEKCEQPTGELLKDIRHTLRRYEQVMPDPTPEQIKKRYKELVTLDADTAHGCLALSEDGRRVTRTETEQRQPDNPKRFTDSRCVLGEEGFTSGRHYWELQLLWEGDGWAAGVSRESVSRKGGVNESPEGGVWAVEGCDGQYRALTSPPSRFSPCQCHWKLGFYLDYDGGRLSVYNADTLEELYTFTGAAFTGRVFPYFCPYWEADLRLV